MKKNLATLRFFVFWLLLSPLLSAQNPDSAVIFRLRPAIDAPLAAGIGLAGGASFFSSKKITAFEPAQVSALLAERAGSPLSFAERSHSTTAARLSDGLVLASGAAAFSACIWSQNDRKQRGVQLAMLAETAALQYFLNATVKNLAHRTRPFVFDPAVSMDEKLKLDARRTFYSGHASGAASMTFFAAKVWSDAHPSSRAKPLVWATAAAWPAAVGFLRMRAGKHYFRDVATGYAIGALIGWGVPALHKAMKN